MNCWGLEINMPIKQDIGTITNMPPDAPLSPGERQVLLAEIRDLKSRLAAMAQMADADPLVPVKNRRAFLRELERAKTIAQRYEIPSCLVFLDLNGFKHINDKYGHNTGDDLLVKIGQELQEHIRDSDIIARLGGDEFGVLLFKTKQDIGNIKAKELAEIISQIRLRDDISVSAAWGTAMCEPTMQVREILDMADKAMYNNKHA